MNEQNKARLSAVANTANEVAQNEKVRKAVEIAKEGAAYVGIAAGLGVLLGVATYASVKTTELLLGK